MPRQTPKRQVALHGHVTTARSVQKYIVTIHGELTADSPHDAKTSIFKAVKEAAKAIPGAHEFWVSQPRAGRKRGPARDVPTEADEIVGEFEDEDDDLPF